MVGCALVVVALGVVDFFAEALLLRLASAVGFAAVPHRTLARAVCHDFGRSEAAAREKAKGCGVPFGPPMADDELCSSLEELSPRTLREWFTLSRCYGRLPMCSDAEREQWKRRFAACVEAFASSEP